ncbi:MAG TPA: TetR family transcriptional regulator [Actinomycetota bacterium]|jgi:AcrR family transcriptional regulator|nr:TetR family transcriptional regulator [Actinomycetota bacterium]
MAITADDLRTGTRERILHAAFDALEDFGLSRTTVEDVAQRAGLSRQTVYRYFPSKDALIVSLVAREEEAFIAGVRDAIEGHEELGPAIANGVAFVLRFAREHPLLDRLVSTDPVAFLPYLTTRGLPVIVRAREAMIDVLQPRAPHLPTDALRGALDGATRAIISYVLTPSERPDEVVAADLAAMLMATLRDPAPDGDARGGASLPSGRRPAP